MPISYPPNGIISKVLILGRVYFIATKALELVEHLDFSGYTKLILVFPGLLISSVDFFIISKNFRATSNEEKHG